MCVKITSQWHVSLHSWFSTQNIMTTTINRVLARLVTIRTNNCERERLRELIFCFNLFIQKYYCNLIYIFYKKIISLSSVLSQLSHDAITSNCTFISTTQMHLYSYLNQYFIFCEIIFNYIVVGLYGSFPYLYDTKFFYF